MRILSWNLWGFRGEAGVVAGVVSDLSPDLMLVQETPWIWRPRRRLRDWADRLGLQVLAGEWCGRALAILGTEAVAEIATGSSVRRSWQAPSTRFPYPRGIAAVRLSPTRGGAFVAASVHFGLDPADRLRHARQLVGLIGSAQAPVVIGGDFNETIDGTARAVVARVAGDPGDPADPTFPASGPVRRIDGIHVSDGMSVRSAEVVTRTPSVPPEQMARASDHLPVVVDTDLR